MQAPLSGLRVMSKAGLAAIAPLPKALPSPPNPAGQGAGQGNVTPLRPLLRQPLKIVAMGDSLVYGFGDVSGGGWVERLRRRWLDPASAGHVVYNLGVRGDKVAQVAARLETEFCHRGELRNRLPDRLILSVGANDTPRVGRPDGRPMTSLAEFTDHLEDLLDRAHALCPVIFVGMVPVNPQPMPFLDCLYYSRTQQYTYKEVARRACAARGIPYFDCFEVWMARGEDWLSDRLGPDGLHPTDLGYQTLLEDVLGWSALKDFLSTRVEEFGI